MKTVLTIGIIYQPPRVLLGLKKGGRMGVGKWNGFGGHVEDGETIEENLGREIEEESALSVIRKEKIGIIEFEFQNEPGKILETHIFLVREFSGEPQETEEMRPAWFDIKDIPYNNMWTVDRYWLPQVLGGKKIRGRVLYDNKELMNILGKDLREVSEI